MTELTVHALATLVDGRLLGDGERVVTGIADLRTAGPMHVGFVRNSRYAAAAKGTKAAVLLVREPLATDAAQIVVRDVDVAYAKAASFFHPMPRATAHAVHPTAVVHPEAELEAPVRIGPHAVIGRCRIGSGTVVQAGVVIGDDVRLGRDCVLFPHVTLYDRVRIGDRFIAHASAVVGSDGFGYANDGGTWTKVPQLGEVEIGDDVEIGVGTVIDRAAVNSTRIGDGTKIDNLCHIAHNCTIGRHVAMAAGVMVAGSTKIGDHCTFGGNAAVAGHIEIVAGVRVGGDGGVWTGIDKPGDYLGNPIVDKRRFIRLQRALEDLPEMHKRWLEAEGAEGAPQE